MEVKMGGRGEGALDDELQRLTAENVALRAEIEQALESQRTADDTREYYVDIFERAPLPFLLLDSVGTIAAVNAAAAALLCGPGVHRALIGSRFRSFLNEAGAGGLLEHLRQCAKASHGLACEVQLADGRPIQLWTNQVTAKARVYCTQIVDLRDRERATAEARRAAEGERAAVEATRAKDDFIAVLSHELRTPLTPVLAAVTALQGRPGLSSELNGTCEMIRRNIAAEARLIDDLLDVTRIARRKMRVEVEPVDVHVLVRDVTESIVPDLATKRLSLRVHLDADLPRVAADAVRLKQVFWNLLKNAIKFTPENGAIEVKSWNSTGSRASWLRVEVSDNGRGFDPISSDRLFDPFEQGHDLPERNGGLGLGLAICKGIVELHHGQISASSRGPQLGARFVVSLPNTEGAPLSLSREMEPPSPLGTLAKQPMRRILLVEDDVDSSEVLTDLLREAGYDVQAEQSVQGALAADLAGMDLLISDIGLPDASGLDLMRRIREQYELPGVALSGYGTEADIRASKEAGFSAHLTKPIDFESLLRAIRQVGQVARQ